ncbi:hypothetical protein LFAB_05830 [Lactiplantibacillus fabifermentans T30PCM01]|uniref:Uncharacterized protein n=1 Tax=Lactiplantibacillus fabifermentans T30PCM01 TaxID=1400520 RepID=W6TCN1_9LACO|nr:hypothetical protein LFAB_05830 [Lactiplantibacillus fabifermentans T30PCM01]
MNKICEKSSGASPGQRAVRAMLGGVFGRLTLPDVFEDVGFGFKARALTVFGRRPVHIAGCPGLAERQIAHDKKPRQ